MRKQLISILLLAFTFCAANVYAAGVYVVNVEKALVDTKAFKAYKKKQEAKNKKPAEEIQGMQEQLKTMGEKLQKELKTKKESELTDQIAAYRKKEIDLRTKAADFQKKAQEAQAKFFEELSPKLDKVIKDLAKKKKADAILTGQAAIFVDDKYNLTKEVTTALDKAK